MRRKSKKSSADFLRDKGLTLIIFFLSDGPLRKLIIYLLLIQKNKKKNDADKIKKDKSCTSHNTL